MTTEVTITLALLLFSVVMFFWEKIPVWVTAMFVLVAFIVTGILEPREAFMGFTDSSVLLYMAMYIIGDALFLTGAANKIGASISKYTNSIRQTVFLIMLIAGIMSGFLSNAGTAAIFIPIILGISESTGYSRSKMLMPLVVAVTTGGILSILGSPPNIIASSILESSGFEPFSVFEFSSVTIPLFIVSIVYYITIGYKLLPESDGDLEDTYEEDYKGELIEAQEVPEWKTKMSVIIMVITVLAMVFENQIDIPFYVSAWIGALVLVASGTVSSSQALDSIDMSTIFLFVGTLSLGQALDKSGAGLFIAQRVLGLFGDHPRAILAAIMLISIVLTNFMSNTATAALMAPIAISIAEGMGVDPRAFMVGVVIGCASSYGTPIGSPPNTMVYNIGGYKFTDYTKVGLPLILISFLAGMILIPYFFPLRPI